MLQRCWWGGESNRHYSQGSAVEGLERILGSYSCFGTLKGSRTPGDAFGTALLLDLRYLLRIALGLQHLAGRGALHEAEEEGGCLATVR